jgi:hypothetical protein
MSIAIFCCPKASVAHRAAFFWLLKLALFGDAVFLFFQFGQVNYCFAVCVKYSLLLRGELFQFVIDFFYRLIVLIWHVTVSQAVLSGFQDHSIIPVNAVKPVRRDFETLVCII